MLPVELLEPASGVNVRFVFFKATGGSRSGVANIRKICVPNLFLECLNKQFAGALDFFDISVDFINHCDMGFGIIHCRAIELGHQLAAIFRGVKTAAPSQVLSVLQGPASFPESTVTLHTSG